ncbi:MAG: hypothetical protein GXP43_02470 [bacterium]|nr:hypothetical protein [bacterium]
MSRRLFLSLAIVILFFLSNPLPAMAEPVGLGVYPPILTVRLTPGGQVKQPIRLFNYMPKDVWVDVQVIAFNRSTPNGLPIWDEAITVPDWIKVTGPINLKYNAHPVKASSYQDFVVNITPPPQTPLNDWYFTVLFKQKPSFDSAKLRLTHQIGMNILLSLDSTLKVKTPVKLAFSRLDAPFLINPWPSEVPLKIQVYNPNSFWVTVLPTIKLKKVIGIGPDQTQILVPVNILGRNKRWIYATEEQMNLALSMSTLQAKDKSKNAPILRLKDRLFGKRHVLNANNLIFVSDSFKFGWYQWQIELWADDSLAGRRTQSVIFFPWWVAGLVLAALAVWRGGSKIKSSKFKVKS